MHKLNYIFVNDWKNQKEDVDRGSVSNEQFMHVHLKKVSLKGRCECNVKYKENNCVS